MGWLVDNRLDEIDVLMKTWNIQYHLHPEMSYELDPNFIITKKKSGGMKDKTKAQSCRIFWKSRLKYQHLQRGAKWFLKGFNSPSLRV